ncbi:hypothetical protein GCM10011517_12200 [Actibacterium pelagium]|uniref:Uncharacterized protein n=1 Tax=Actibacterium pelagium TaxID=2029103 RepID=A0A917EHX1_9RHOB|nr:hypothetical protein GCM10011517_12200 [Actibacterium pelagium]
MTGSALRLCVFAMPKVGAIVAAAVEARNVLLDIVMVLTIDRTNRFAILPSQSAVQRPFTAGYSEDLKKNGPHMSARANP